MKKTIGLALILCFFIFTARAASAPVPRLMVMLYMAGGDLETESGAASRDLAEIMASLPEDGSVEVLALLSGAKAWKNGVSPDESAVYRVSRDGLEKLRSWPLRSMGEARTLSDFLRFSYGFSAERFALILWDHGAGPVLGVCFDEQFQTGNEMDALTLSELQAALTRSPFAEEKLSWLGFDACLMASVETACAVAPYADYLVASQELESAAGWNYVFLKEAGNQTAQETAKAIVDAYMDDQGNSLRSAALSAVDLSRMEAVAREMDSLFDNLPVDIEHYPLIARSRIDAKAAACSAPVDFDLVDLIDLLDVCRENGVLDGSALMKRLKDAILYSRANIPFLNGLSVYFPFRNKADYVSPWSGLYQKAAVPKGYRAFLDRFTAVWMGSALSDWYSPQALEQQVQDNTVALSMSLTPEEAAQFASARVVVVEDYGYYRYCRVYESPAVALSEDGTLTAAYRGESLFMLNARGEPMTGALSYDALEDGIGIRAILYKGKRWEKDYAVQSAYLVYALEDAGNYTLAAVYPMEENRALIGKTDLRLDDWDKIQLINPWRKPAYDGEGRPLPYSQWSEGTIVSVAVKEIQDMRPAFMRMQDQKKRLVFLEIRDLQNNAVCSAMYPLENPNRHEIGPGSLTILDNRDFSLVMDRLELWTGDAPFIRQCFTAVNRTEKTIKIKPSDVRFDDTWMPEKSLPCLTLEPNKVFSFDVTLYVDRLEEYRMPYVDAIHCTLTGLDEEDGLLFREAASVPLRLDLRGLVRQEGDEALCGAEWQGLNIRVMGFEKQNAVYFPGLVCLLCLENGGEEALQFRIDGVQFNDTNVNVGVLTPTGCLMDWWSLPGGMKTYLKINLYMDQWDENTPIEGLTLYLKESASASRDAVAFTLPEPVWIQDCAFREMKAIWWEADYDY